MTAVKLQIDREPPDRQDWNIDSIVSALRDLRHESLAARNRLGKPAKLPSRAALTGIVEGLSAALFPNRLSSQRLTHENVDYFVGHTLDIRLRELMDQIVRELHFHSDHDGASEAHHRHAADIVQEFAGCLPQIRAILENDIQAAYEGDPAARSIDEVLACYPGITAIIHHRLAHALYRLNAPLVARMIGEIAHSTTGIDIHPGAQINKSFFIDHGTGVVIGETAIIGERGHWRQRMANSQRTPR